VGGRADCGRFVRRWLSSTAYGTSDMGIRAQVLDTGHRGQDPRRLLPLYRPASVEGLCSVYAVCTYGVLTVMHNFFFCWS
jgi:hypothetical protein